MVNQWPTQRSPTATTLVNEQKVAMQENGVLTYLLGDHLGSTSIQMDNVGNVLAEQRYLPFGSTRYTSSITPTDYQYTGQRVESVLGLYDYKARWYDPVLGRFLQPDTLVPNPGSPMAYDRYAYVFNNPMRYTDPSGYRPCAEMHGCDDEILIDGEWSPRKISQRTSSATTSNNVCTPLLPYGNPFYDGGAKNWGAYVGNIQVHTYADEMNLTDINLGANNQPFVSNPFIFALEVFGILNDVLGPFSSSANVEFIQGFVYFSVYSDGRKNVTGATIKNSTEHKIGLIKGEIEYRDRNSPSLTPNLVYLLPNENRAISPNSYQNTAFEPSVIIRDSWVIHHILLEIQVWDKYKMPRTLYLNSVEIP